MTTTTLFTIEDLYASACENAIDHMAFIATKALKNEYTRKEDWVFLENLAKELEAEFDIDGELVKIGYKGA